MAKETGAAEAETAAARGGFFRKTRKRLASSFRLNRRWKLLEFQWLYGIHLSIVDDFLFKIVSTFELIALLALLSFYFLCCGCSL